MLTHDEVVWGYRYLLGRDPESAQAIEGHSHHAGWREFRAALLDSPEFMRVQGTRKLPPKWVAAEVFGGERLLWLDLADSYVSCGCLYNSYEPLETAFVAANLGEGDVFLDIGANIGWFTMLATTLIGEKGQVHAFEPRKPTVDYLRRSVTLNGLDAIVTVYDVGLDETGTRPLSRLGKRHLKPGAFGPFGLGRQRRVRKHADPCDDARSNGTRKS